MQTGFIKKGWGYDDITIFPVGGCFRRAQQDMPLTIEREEGRYIVGRLADGKTRVWCDKRSVEITA